MEIQTLYLRDDETLSQVNSAGEDTRVTSGFSHTGDGVYADIYLLHQDSSTTLLATKGFHITISQMIGPGFPTWITSYPNLRWSTWNCPETQIAITDKLRLHTYIQFQSGAYACIQDFDSAAPLGMTKLVAATWTRYFWIQIRGVYYTTTLYYGGATHSSRLEDVRVIRGTPIPLPGILRA